VNTVDRAHRGMVLEVRFSPNPDAKALATLGSDGAVKLWDLANPARNYTLDASRLGPLAISWTSTGQGLGGAGKSGEIGLFSTDSGRVVRTLPKRLRNGATAEINQMQFLADDREIVCGGVAAGNGGWAAVVSAETGEARVSFDGHTNTVSAVN